MRPAFADLLRDQIKGIAEISVAQIAALEAHYELMLRWNKTLNLTRITALEEVVERHYVESLFLGSQLPPGGLQIADVGSGAGFPGFPIAVLRPDCSVTLIESHQRKAVFLKEASRDLRNVQVLAKRFDAVDLKFDWVISRAVSYKDLHGSVGRLSTHLALLTGGEVPPTEWNCVWKETLGIPGPPGRFLRMGEVSRETSSFT
jgi:16S rRNA (guanine(527)-N(7))-methyltransferase RsmG